MSNPSGPGRLNRRQFLAAGAGAAAFLATGGLERSAWAGPAGRHGLGSGSRLTRQQREALQVLGRSELRAPGSRFDPGRPAGTDTLPWFSNMVILMMENHSYDNLLGMLGRHPGGRPKGDGFSLDRHGRPTASNPYGDGRIQHAFHMPTTCQLPAQPSQEWQDSHTQYANGRMDGFVRSRSGPVAMGYWTSSDIPFTYSLASTFPLADRWFASTLAQTDPNRRFLIAATAAGMTDDIGTGPGNVVPDSTLMVPASGGTIFNQLDRHGLTWTDYTASYPTGTTAELFPVNDSVSTQANHSSFEQFFSDAATGRLPHVSLLDPNYSTESQENPQNIVLGDALLARVVHAVTASPQWRQTMLVVLYDEHGGYYDHVPPPVALVPDPVPPTVQPGQSTYDGYARYGFRVPAIVVSPYARKAAVTHVVHDHTSVLAMIERKWNLPALTYRDANANDLLDFIDLRAVRARRPTFPTRPRLAAPGDTQAALACSHHGPGQIPPPESVSRAR